VRKAATTAGSWVGEMAAHLAKLLVGTMVFAWAEAWVGLKAGD
jgi:hypothetical protein